MRWVNWDVLVTRVLYLGAWFALVYLLCWAFDTYATGKTGQGVFVPNGAR